MSTIDSPESLERALLDAWAKQPTLVVRDVMGTIALVYLTPDDETAVVVGDPSLQVESHPGLDQRFIHRTPDVLQYPLEVLGKSPSSPDQERS